MRKPWVKVLTKIYIFTPWGEIQIGTKYRTLAIWHRGKRYIIKRPAKKFLEG